MKPTDKKDTDKKILATICEKSDNTESMQTSHIIPKIHTTEENTSTRRKFLKGLSLGSVAMMAGVALPARAQLLDLSSTTGNNTRLPTRNNNSYSNSGENWQEMQPVTQCISATIATRLFSSSNASTSHKRNLLAINRLRCAGFNIENPEIMRRKYYRFGGSDSQRANDFENIAQGKVSAPKLLLGVRGGYGAMRILQKVDWHKLGRIINERETIIGGFSDVTAIQCALLAKGNASSSNLPMAYSEFGKFQPDPISCHGFVKAITEPNLVLSIYNARRTHSALPVIMGRTENHITGTIWGGNLSVLSALSGTQYMPRPLGGIVFIEEVGEPPYRVERMLYTLYLAGAFDNQQAIVFGAMARIGKDGYDPAYNVPTVIRELQRLTKLPIYSGVGFGHVSKKQSFPMGCQCDLVRTTMGFDMKFSRYPTIDKSLISEPALSK